MDINHCLRCGRDWCYRGEGRALRCGKCKSPYWDRPMGNAIQPVLVSVPDSVSEVPRKPVQSAAEPSMDILREMAAGRIPAEYREPAKNAGTSIRQTAYPVEKGEALFFLDRQASPGNGFMNDEAGPEAEMCPIRGRDDQRGEWILCALPKHDPRKVKCVPGERVPYDE